MTTIPYVHNGELIDLVPKSELDKALADNAELLERLEERTQSHLHASARDVQTIQQQAVELAKWQAEASLLSAEREHNANMADLWRSVADGLARRLNLWHNAAGNRCNIQDADALAAYESYKKGEQP